jgi:hypothetical protein
MMLAVAVAALVVIGVLALAGFASGASQICSSCHAPQAVALAASPHTGIGCERCHFAVQGPLFGRVDTVTRMVPASAGGVRLHNSGRPVGNAVCISCHPKLVNAGVLSKSGLRINHTKCTVAEQCETCHSQSIHGTSMRLVRRLSMADCVACHTEQNATLVCSACHVGKIPTGRAGDPDFERAHGPDWRTMHGTGDLRTCFPCHESSDCRRCHGIDFPHPNDFGVNHGKLAEEAGQKACLTCHKQSKFCSGCHTIEMPHPAGFLQRHGSVATSVNDRKCATCHVLSDCAQCHTYHVHPYGRWPTRGGTVGGG